VTGTSAWLSGFSIREPRGGSCVHTVGGHDVCLPANTQVWSPHSAIEMLAALVEAGHLDDLENLRVLDIGTGSGIVGILCGLRGSKDITLSDYSPAAVEQALGNARLNGLFGGVQVRGVQSDRFSDLGRGEGEYDLIISNPPVQPWLHTDKASPEDRPSAGDWNEAGDDGRRVLDALIERSHDYLSDDGTLITSCSTRHGHAKTIELLNRHWQDHWEIVYAVEHAINPEYHGPYLPIWQRMQAVDGDLRVYQIDARQRRFSRQTAPDGGEFVLTILDTDDGRIPVRFAKTNQGWRITDSHGDTLGEVGDQHPDVPGPALTDRWYFTYFLVRAQRRRDADAPGKMPIAAHASAAPTPSAAEAPPVR
jgi:methylase of polypeptide subunit release factors